MNRKTIKSFLYQLRDDRKAVIIYYAVILAVYTFVLISAGVSISGDGVIQSNGFGISTAIFMFCLCAFKENFYMLSQNGVSRKSVFMGRVINAFTLSVIMSVLDVTLKSIYGFITGLLNESFLFESIFDMLYLEYIREVNSFVRVLMNLLFFIAVYFCFNMLGYLMGTLFHRLNKTIKVIFAAGLPTTIFVIFPIVDFTFFGGNMSMNLFNFIIDIFAIRSQQPLYAVLSFLVITAICSALSWLFIRKAKVE